MDLENCAKVCFSWFGRKEPGAPLLHDVVFAGAQFGSQCYCLPGTEYPPDGFEHAIKPAKDGPDGCNTPCKGKAGETCGGGWHNTVMRIECGSNWGWSVIITLMVCSALYLGGGVAYAHKTQGVPIGPEALPHREFWSAVLGLVRDGATFSHAKLREAHEQHRAGGGGGYEAVESEAAEAPAAKLPPRGQETPQGEPEGSSDGEEDLVE